MQILVRWKTTFFFLAADTWAQTLSLQLRISQCRLQSTTHHSDKKSSSTRHIATKIQENRAWETLPKPMYILVSDLDQQKFILIPIRTPSVQARRNTSICLPAQIVYRTIILLNSCCWSFMKNHKYSLYYLQISQIIILLNKQTHQQWERWKLHASPMWSMSHQNILLNLQQVETIEPFL